MLWTKESNKKNALYVDVFSFKSAGFYNNIEAYMKFRARENPSCNKSNVIAVEKRVDGNRSFAKGDWMSALGMYNDSLCYAEPGSENVSLAYANRSACFFHLKKYNECLIDIELAKSCEGYPSRLTPKLDKRQDDAVKLTQEVEQVSDNRLKLDYEPDERFPCIANVLQVEKNTKGNLVMVAKEDIPVGKIIAVDKAFATCLYSKFGWRCCICLKEDTNLMPCTNCNVAMFCSKQCQSSLIHEYECGLRFCKSTQENGLVMNDMRMVLKAIEIFPNVDELMAFVEDAIQSDPNEIPETLFDEKSKYRAFLKLPYYSATSKKDTFLESMYITYKMLMRVPTVKTMFKSKWHDRFLKHLLMQQALVMDENSIRTRLPSIEPNPENRGDICTHTGLFKRYFEHSCAPNMLWIGFNGYSVYITIRPLKQGDQLFTTMFDLLLEPKQKRQKILWDSANFVCECSLCAGPSATPQQRKQLLSDPLYRSGLDGDPEKCVAILEKYAHGPLCEEMKMLLHNYCMKIRYQYSGPTNIRAFAEIFSDNLFNQ